MASKENTEVTLNLSSDFFFPLPLSQRVSVWVEGAVLQLHTAWAGSAWVLWGG